MTKEFNMYIDLNYIAENADAIEDVYKEGDDVFVLCNDNVYTIEASLMYDWYIEFEAQEDEFQAGYDEDGLWERQLDSSIDVVNLVNLKKYLHYATDTYWITLDGVKLDLKKLENHLNVYKLNMDKLSHDAYRIKSSIYLICKNIIN